jgi:hypothetical protein
VRNAGGEVMAQDAVALDDRVAPFGEGGAEHTNKRHDEHKPGV